MTQLLDTISIDAQENAAGKSETKRLAAAARAARISSQIDACKVLEKYSFRMAELARQGDLSFLAYLSEMLRVAAVDERAKLGRLAHAI